MELYKKLITLTTIAGLLIPFGSGCESPPPSTIPGKKGVPMAVVSGDNPFLATPDASEQALIEVEKACNDKPLTCVKDLGSRPDDQGRLRQLLISTGQTSNLMLAELFPNEGVPTSTGQTDVKMLVPSFLTQKTDANWQKVMQGKPQAGDGYLIEASMLMEQYKLSQAYGPTLKTGGYEFNPAQEGNSVIPLAQAADWLLTAYLLGATDKTSPGYQLALSLKEESADILHKYPQTKNEYLAEIPQNVFLFLEDAFSMSQTRDQLLTKFRTYRPMFVEWQMAKNQTTKKQAETIVDGQLAMLLNQIKSQKTTAILSIALDIIKPMVKSLIINNYGLPPEAAEVQTLEIYDLMKDSVDKLANVENKATLLPVQLSSIQTEYVLDALKNPSRFKISFSTEQGKTQELMVDVPYILGDKQKKIYAHVTRPLSFFKVRSQDGTEKIIAGMISERNLNADTKFAFLTPLEVDRQTVFSEEVVPASEALGSDAPIELQYVTDGVLWWSKQRLTFAGTPVMAEIDFQKNALAAQGGLPLEKAVAMMLDTLQNSNTGLFDFTGLPEGEGVQQKLWRQLVYFTKDTNVFVLAGQDLIPSNTIPARSSLPIEIEWDSTDDSIDNLNPFTQNRTLIDLITKVNGKEVKTTYLKLKKLRDQTYLVVEYKPDNTVKIGSVFTEEQWLNEMIPMSRFVLFASLLPLEKLGPYFEIVGDYSVVDKVALSIPPKTLGGDTRMAYEMFTRSLGQKFQVSGEIMQNWRAVYLSKGVDLIGGGKILTGVANEPLILGQSAIIKPISLGQAAGMLIPQGERELFMTQAAYLGFLKASGIYFTVANMDKSKGVWADIITLAVVKGGTPAKEVVPIIIK